MAEARLSHSWHSFSRWTRVAMQDLTPRGSAARLAEELPGVGAAQGGVHELDRMERRHGPPGPPERGRDLHQAARVPTRVGVRLRSEHLLRLAVAELSRGLRLEEVVDAGAPAADRLVGRLGELEARNRPQNGARGRPDALRVREMARVLERDAERERLRLGPRLPLGEHLGDVADARRAGRRTLRVGGG